MSPKNILNLIYYFFFKKNFYKLRKKIFSIGCSADHNIKSADLVNSIKKNGYVIIENFIRKDSCQLIIDQIEKFLITKPEFCWADNEHSDQRIHGAENLSLDIFNFFNSKIPIEVGESYHQEKLQNLMTMANKTTFVNNNRGSGQGWHRDGIHSQYKSILYLVDVNEHNGPFQIIQNSNKLKNIIHFCTKYNLDIFNTRINNNAVQDYLKNNISELKTIVAKAGTLILVETSTIHRGKPMLNGTRYALTNYYYPKILINKYQNNFFPFLKERLF